MYTYIKTIYKKIPFKRLSQFMSDGSVATIEDQTENTTTDWLTENKLSQLMVDVYERDNEYVVKAIAPDVAADEVKVTIDDNKLILKINRKEAHADENINYLYNECYWGGYEKTIELPGEITNKDITAVLKKGVLTVKIKKLIKTGPMIISVKNDE